MNIAVLSTFTSEVLRPYVIVESAARGILARPYFGPFNQIDQSVLDDASPLYDSKPDVVVLAARTEEIAPNLISRFFTLSSADVNNELARIEEWLQSMVEGLRRFCKATILVFNYAPPHFLVAGLSDASLESPQVSVIERANERVAEVCRKFSGTYVFDYARITYEFGMRCWYDPKLWYLGKIPFGAQGQLETGRRLARYVRAACLPSCKCLVLDLDNTLWGGVLGEEGLGGIALGEDYPGNVYKDFQRSLLSLRDRGVLLAVASKNNEVDVLEVFHNHPDCVLKTEDFSSLQIHWQDKAGSLRSVAKELNIGTDALAFFDDNRVEREWVRSHMPEVTVIEVPENPLDFARALDESGAFDHLAISAEDQKRGEMHQKERERRRLQSESISLEDFLWQLNMTATIGFVGQETLPRVAQLVAKTNQFNLTTRRHTPSELQAMIESGAVALWLRVADRFADNGLVGVALAVPEDSPKWLIDTFLLSCRVIGRQVERVLLSMLVGIIRERGGLEIVGEYVSTAKNAVAGEFYQMHGFTRGDNIGRYWIHNSSAGDIALPPFISVNMAGGDKR